MIDSSSGAWASRVGLSVANRQTSHILAIPTIRLGEVRETVRVYDETMIRHGHNLPILVVLDCAREDCPDDASRAKWDSDYEQLLETARQCKNDVFIVTRKHKEEFMAVTLESLRATNPQVADELEQGLWDEMFSPGPGANKDWCLLYTIGTEKLGSKVLLIDDDVRPYGLEAKAVPNFYDTDHVFEGREINLGESVHDILSALDQPIQASVTVGGETLEEGLPEYNMVKNNLYRFGSTKLARSMVERMGMDVVGSVFSTLGSTVKQICGQYDKAMFGHNAYYDDSHPRTNTTLANYPHLHDLTNEKGLPLGIEGNTENSVMTEEEHRFFRGTKPYTIGMRLEPPRTAPDQNAIIKYASPILCGIPDYDAPDFLKEILSHEGIEDQHETYSMLIFHRLKGRLAICGSDYTIHAGSLGIDNSDGCVPNIRGMRMDEFSWRLDSSRKGYASVKIPFAQTHLRSPARQELAKVAFMEEVGTLLKVLLLNGQNEQGMYEGDMDFSPSISADIAENGKKYYDAFMVQTQFNHITDGRRALLLSMAQQLKAEYCDFDVEKIHDKASGMIRKELTLFNRMREIWPDIQQIARDNKHVLHVTNAKTGDEVPIGKVMSDPKYSKQFIVNYHYDTISNLSPANRRSHSWIAGTEYRGAVSSAAAPIRNLIGLG